MNEIRDHWFCSEGVMPINFSAENFKKFMFDLREIGDFDDVFFQQDEKVKVKSQGKLLWCSERKLSGEELELIANNLSGGTNGGANLRDGITLSKALDVVFKSKKTNKNTIYRFRVQGLAHRTRTGKGLRFVLRKISPEPHDIKNQGLNDELVRALVPPNGLVVVAGETGSGKSTLLSSIIKHILETHDNLVINTGEAPVEATYFKVPTNCIIAQHDIPDDIPDFTTFLENCLRTNPDIALVGECKTDEISRKVIELAQTGHTTYTTLHADSVESVIRRLTKAFGKDQESGLFDVLSSLRVIVIQKLIGKKGGGRIACRSTLCVTEEVRNRLINTTPETLMSDVKEIVHTYGVRMHEHAEKLFQENLIDEKTLRWMKAGV